MSRRFRESEDSSAVAPATAEETRSDLIDRARRSFTPIPKVFVQNPDGAAEGGRAGPLADFVRRGDKRALIAFLLLHTIISSDAREDGWSCTLHLKVWARALDTVATASDASATSAVTKIFSRLVDRQLIERRRSGRQRQVTVTLLSADGRGDPYERPKGKTRIDRFLRLNHQFWSDGWDRELSLPAIAMLLVALHEKPRFTLATEHMPRWYGWSADTAERGLRELRDAGILQVDRRYRTEPLSPTGVAAVNIYTVSPPFDPDSVDRDANAARKKRGQ